jgi:hypothetical protein
MKARSYLLLCGAAVAFAGCMDGRSEKSEGNEPQTGETGLAIQAAVNTGGGTDVAYLEYGIDRVACVADESFEPLKRTIRVELSTMLLPGGIPAWENSPLDKSSKHPFADHFEVLPAGCYNVQATPLAGNASVSQDCAAAFMNDVEVDDGLTTEIFMISQCKGIPTGAIDSVVALNRPPTLLNLTFTPSKFIASGQKTTVCATATDPNGDPLEFQWDQIGGSLCGADVVSDSKLAGSTTECVDIEPMEAGDYLFDVRIYDLLHNEDNNKLIRFETWLSEHGYPNTSHASLRFPVYVGAAL